MKKYIRNVLIVLVLFGLMVVGVYTFRGENRFHENTTAPISQQEAYELAKEKVYAVYQERGDYGEFSLEVKEPEKLKNGWSVEVYVVVSDEWEIYNKVIIENGGEVILETS